MKKYLKAVFAVVLAVALLLPLAACGNKTEKIKIAVPNDTTLSLIHISEPTRPY